MLKQLILIPFEFSVDFKTKLGRGCQKVTSSELKGWGVQPGDDAM